MKILVLSNDANGMYLFRKEVLLAFREKGYETVLSLPPDKYCEKIDALGFRIIPTKLERRGSNPIHDFKLFIRYIKIISEEKPDVVLTYTIKPNIYGGLACMVKRKPYLVNITGLGTALEKPGLMGKALLKFYQIAAMKASCVFFQNDKNRQFMLDRGIGIKKNRLLPGSGINLSEHTQSPYPPETDEVIFLAVLRIMKDKGIAEYLETAQSIGKDYENVSFYLAGEYEEDARQVYEPRIKELADEGVIKYLGHIDNVAQVMAKSHVIVHPSYHEGLSNVLLEAAACGRPILASDVAGCRETVQPGISGILFEPEDAQALIQAVKTILGYTESERRQMGIKGREYVESAFDREKVIGAYLEEISDVCQSTGWEYR